MKARFSIGLVAIAAIVLPALPQQKPPARVQARIAREVRHQLLMLPYVNAFDNLTYKIDGYNVTLGGAVTQASVKSSAEAVVRKVEGVEHVDNQIEVLPPSPMDNRLRMRLYRAIYGYPPLQRYALPVIKPIRIIVKNGHVTLEGVVDTEADKNLVTVRARGVPGTFSVTNNLAVAR